MRPKNDWGISVSIRVLFYTHTKAQITQTLQYTGVMVWVPGYTFILGRA